MENGSTSEYSDHHRLDKGIDPDDHWIAQFVDQAYPLSFKSDALLCGNLMPKKGVHYKYFTSIVELYFNPSLEYGSEVEFFKGTRTTNFIRDHGVSPFLSSNIVNVIPYPLGNDGNALERSRFIN